VIARKNDRIIQKRNPQNLFANSSLGLALARLGRAAEAMDSMEQGARNDAERRWTRALLYPALERRYATLSNPACFMSGVRPKGK
jgi:hypothetical protein